eukprot:TRINITY_DN9799_c3_g1_i1.p1 TRINITY_DN9799_c3_g1~~TRINITY_DN9799_c3_g1_i1.p1  ORF type:complete len:717 (+),score=124.10 TRINITY_DN9799_c3_g1_i1:51-2201(+)
MAWLYSEPKGFPGGIAGPRSNPLASEPAVRSSLSSYKELEELKARLRQEEQTAVLLRQHVQQRIRVPPVQAEEFQPELWQYRPPDGAPLHIRRAPDLEAPRSENLLNPGDLFHVVEHLPKLDGVTFLRLADGRGWAFDHKVAVVAGRPEAMQLCVRAADGTSQSESLQRMASPHRTQVMTSGYVPADGASAHLSRPSILDSRLPLQEASSIEHQSPPRMAVVEQSLPTAASSQVARVAAEDKYRELYLHGQLEGFEILSPDTVFRSHFADGPQRHLSGQPNSPMSGRSQSQVSVPPSTSVAHVTGRGLEEKRWPQLLRVRVLAAHGLPNRDVASFFGNKSDPYVVVRFGGEERKTPVINDCLDPVWKEERDFSFPVHKPQEGLGVAGTLELEVFNSNMLSDDTMGRTSCPLERLAQFGRWQRQVDALKSRSKVAPAQGELEYEICIGEEVHHLETGTSVASSGPSGFKSSGLASSAGAPPPPPQELQPGIYKVISPTAVYKTALHCTDRDIVGNVSVGDDIHVLEVVLCAADARVRGRIENPEGWIPLLDTSDGFSWINKHVETHYLVDNTWLRAARGGLAYRFSKNLDDKDSRPGEFGGPPWGSEVIGFDEGDGWVKVQDGRYLPLSVDGVPVLKVITEDDLKHRVEGDQELAAENELDRLYRELNRRMSGSRPTGASDTSLLSPSSRPQKGGIEPSRQPNSSIGSDKMDLTVKL